MHTYVLFNYIFLLHVEKLYLGVYLNGMGTYLGIPHARL